MKEDRNSAVELTRALIQIESTNPGMGESGMERFLLKYLYGHGVELASEEVFPGRNNVMARIDGTKKGPALVFICHMDTVVLGEGWNYPPLEAVERDGKIYGRGACDMKSGLACALSVFKETARKVEEGSMKLKYPMVLLCTVDEEGYMSGVERAIASERVSSEDWILDMEPTGGQIQAAHKGRLWMEVTMKGVTAHASTPFQGADANASMAEVIRYVRRAFAQCPVHEELGNSTVTFGQIKGGYQPYVVPDSCTLWIDMRLVPPTDDAEAIRIVKQAIAYAQKEVPGTKGRYEITGNRPAIERDEYSRLLKELKLATQKVTGQEAATGPFPGYTDTAVIAGRLSNHNCMSYGPGRLEMAHKPDEYVEIADIIRCERVLSELVKNMLTE